MRIVSKKLYSIDQTASAIFERAFCRASDMLPYVQMEPISFYLFLQSLYYKLDDRENPLKKQETISRPSYVMAANPPKRVPRDCKNKAVAAIAYFRARQIAGIDRVMPGVRLAFVGDQWDPEERAYVPHHVYPEFLVGSVWVPFDATFPDRGGPGEQIYEERYRKEFSLPEKITCL